MDYWKVIFRCFGCCDVGHLQRDYAKEGKESPFKKSWVRKDVAKKDVEYVSKNNVEGGKNEVSSELQDKQDDEESRGSEKNHIGSEYERSRDNIEKFLDEGTRSGETSVGQQKGGVMEKGGEHDIEKDTRIGEFQKTPRRMDSGASTKGSHISSKGK